MHLWQKGKEKLNGCWWPHSCYHIISSLLQNRKGGPNWTGVTKDSMLFQKSITIRYWDYNQAKLFWPEWMMYFQHTPSPSVDSLRVGWDKVVWNYPIPYLISYPCAIFSGTWVRCQCAENQLLLWKASKECSPSVPPYHDSIPKQSSGVPKSGSLVWREQIPDSVISVYNNK